MGVELVISSIGVLGASLAASIYIYIVSSRIRRLEDRIRALEYATRRLIEREKTITRAVLEALKSSEAERFLSKLRAKRRKRYIAFQIVYEGEEPPPPDDVEKAIVKAVEKLGGQIAVALGRVQLAYYNPERAVGVIRCTHDTKYIVLAALGIIRRIGRARAIIIPLRTSGTIKRAKKALAET